MCTTQKFNVWIHYDQRRQYNRRLLKLNVEPSFTIRITKLSKHSFRWVAKTLLRYYYGRATTAASAKTQAMAVMMGRGW